MNNLGMSEYSFLRVLALNFVVSMVGTLEFLVYASIWSVSNITHHLLIFAIVLWVFVLSPVLSIFLWGSFRTEDGPLKPFLKALWCERRLDKVTKVSLILALPFLLGGLILNLSGALPEYVYLAGSLIESIGLAPFLILQHITPVLDRLISQNISAALAYGATAAVWSTIAAIIAIKTSYKW